MQDPPRILATRHIEVSEAIVKPGLFLNFIGVSAGDAPENKGLVAHIDGLAAGKGVQLYIDIHSYSQLFMTRQIILPYFSPSF